MNGKDYAAWVLTIRQAIKNVGVYYYIFPTYAQAKKVIWDSITNDGERFLHFIPTELVESMNSQELKIRVVNGSIIQLCGSSDIDSLVGTNPRGIVFSEYSLQDPRAYQYMRPILTANKGWALFISTVRGRNHLFDLWNIAQANQRDWYSVKMSVEDTKHINIEDINKERDSGEMSDEMIRAEYYNDFNTGVIGSYYANYVDRMRLNNQIGLIPWQPDHKVHTAWDLGVADSTSIVFFQHIAGTVRIIDCYEKSKEGLEHYVNVVKSKPYTYGKHIAPHDIRVTEWGSGMTRLDKARQLGIIFTIAPNIDVMDGIEAVRSMLPKTYIDENKCAWIIRVLENYRQEWDDKKKIYRLSPLHDKYSHMADAIRYLAVSLPKTKDGKSSEEYDKIRQQALYGETTNMTGFEPWRV